MNQVIILNSADNPGLKGKLAKAARCQPAYLSQVLHGDNHLNIEQAEALASALFTRDDEIEFFLLLVMSNRTQSASLKKRLKKRILSLVEARQNLSKRLAAETSSSLKTDPEYFSSWLYSATHAAVGVPNLQEPAALAKTFGISHIRAQEVLNHLALHGLIEQKKDGRYVATNVVQHIGKDSPWLHLFLKNILEAALRKLDDKDPANFNYGAFVTISEESFIKLKEKLTLLVEEIIKEVKASSSEKLCLVNLQLYPYT